MIKLYMDNKLIATEDVMGVHKIVRLVDLDESIENIPANLFGYGNNRRSWVYLGEFMKWAEERCFPEDRTDARELLDSIGLKEYDKGLIKYFSNSQYASDWFWVDWGVTEDEIRKENPDKFF